MFLALTAYCADRERRALALRVAINGFFAARFAVRRLLPERWRIYPATSALLFSFGARRIEWIRLNYAR